MFGLDNDMELPQPPPSEPERSAGSLERAGSATPEIYVFERAEGWYPLELKDDAEARQNAECNPGTLRVTSKSGRPVWPNSVLSDSIAKIGGGNDVDKATYPERSCGQGEAKN